MTFGLRRLATVALSGVLLIAAVPATMAQVTAEATPVPDFGSACLVAPARLSDAEIQAFLGAPEALLAANPAGGLPLANSVRALAASSSVAFEVLVAALSSANADQSAAIGAGLARAVNACQAINAEYGDEISLLVAGLDNEDLITAFGAALNQVEPGAIDGGVGAGGTANGGASPLGEAGRVTGAANNTTFGGDDAFTQSGGDFSVGSAGNFITRRVSEIAP